MQFLGYCSEVVDVNQWLLLCVCVSALEQAYDHESSDPDAQMHNYFCVVLGCNAICHIL